MLRCQPYVNGRWFHPLKPQKRTIDLVKLREDNRLAYRSSKSEFFTHVQLSGFSRFGLTPDGVGASGTVAGS